MFFLKDLPSRRMVDDYVSRFDGVDPARVLGAIEAMRSASILIRDLEAYFAAHDLSQLRFLTLILIDREPERTSLTASEIADALDVSRPVITRTLQNLEQAGLIRITASEADARAREVSLTEAGTQRLEEVLPEYYAILHRSTVGQAAGQAAAEEGA